MKPMKPMKPMEGMKPMEPMKPMAKVEPWWPSDLGEPSTSGGQNDLKYAFFSDKQRLLISQGGQTKTYDTGDRRINGVSQQNGSGSSLAFSSQQGVVKLDDLKEVQ